MASAAWLASLAGRNQILIPESLHHRLGASFECTGLGTRQLPGSSEPLALCEVVRRKEPLEDTADPTLPPPT